MAAIANGQTLSQKARAADLLRAEQAKVSMHLRDFSTAISGAQPAHI
jgi:hypothetical protein